MHLRQDSKPGILIADNEHNIRTVLSALLEREGYDVTAVANGAEARQVLDHKLFRAVITDLKMPEMDGMELLHWLRKHQPDVPVIMITAFATVDTAVEALKAGAFDYITKPFDLEEMRNVVGKACKNYDLASKEIFAEIEWAEDGTSESFSKIIGQNATIQEVCRLAQKVANSPSPVLITGESGTGKGLIARMIHFLSLRKNKPFIQINCAAIPQGLIESELFGYEKGAFTGAVTSKPGRFELAQGGTLFLDEIGEVTPDVQVKLLRAVQQKEFERVGGVKTITVDVRLITATNRELKSDIKNGRFREDLYYRLNVIPIHLPPLRERIDDIPLLAHFFCEKLAKKAGQKRFEIHPDALALLTRYAWPGNIRELENVVERAIVLSEKPVITTDLLPPEVQGESADAQETPLSDLKEAVRQQGTALEREMILRALDQNDGNVTRTAKNLGISRKSLQLKMRQYALREKD